MSLTSRILVRLRWATSVAALATLVLCIASMRMIVGVGTKAGWGIYTAGGSIVVTWKDDEMFGWHDHTIRWIDSQWSADMMLPPIGLSEQRIWIASPVLVALFIALATAGFMAKRRESTADQCKACGYPVRQGHVCTECGRATAAR